MQAKRREQIANAVRNLQLEVWHAAMLKYPSGMPPVPQLFSPQVVAEKCGYSYELRHSMPRANVGARFETAGMIDNGRKIIMVSGAQPYEVQRFTGAHEIGHLVLHRAEPGMGQHRDRPLSGASMGPRSVIEEEADLFAALLLAPSKSVKIEFQKRFGDIPLVLNELTAYHLAGHKGANDLMASTPESLVFATAVARATKFGNKRFDSLAHFFGMSITAMAIRLRELSLVAY
ncbi:ImmA/IrrE family metallo-endopeptidase [Burkholderia pseudomallei]|uniref:ImmA/IrrE family metallo-endopeptidase n=2 Tax=Burkholderia pseudomallei TaxID=28450 RepID=UPI001E41C1FE|nr:ImmA/IrrE family metallo-endopeptidase [Burkholderia pseudomallei]MCD4545370.1 ImmA/IrrE family metallo-endopeptidase [Burkholderia pseudomallei]MCW0012402.1 ImmA/IrrE family metallo-endopeptidase [Burkholderia pseudomallei]MDK2569864.1 ImmA/IrrE family metallo-endopeptidase [Burkholderia pseudomallei]MDS1023101.1 ImmA/IrrE family metallo-endopeptidase [Burkholderia pseudomallei]MDV2228697.1 ImmA/IrrE family metallo-endopeptidase [Burkholderia pseudomallei]